MANPTLSDISGIGPSAAEILEKGGFSTVAAVADAAVGALAALHGFGQIRAARTIAAARALLDASEGTQEATSRKSKVRRPKASPLAEKGKAVTKGGKKKKEKKEKTPKKKKKSESKKRIKKDVKKKLDKKSKKKPGGKKRQKSKR